MRGGAPAYDAPRRSVASGSSLQLARAFGEVAGPRTFRLVDDALAGKRLRALLQPAAQGGVQGSEREDVALRVRAAETLGDAANGGDLFHCLGVAAGIEGE